MYDSRKTTVRFTDSWASVHYDLLRGVAACLVLVEHWRNLFFVDFPQLGEHRLLLALPYTLAGVGHQAVVVFFILSGYFIGGSVFRLLERNQWRWRGYLLRRLVRLWTVLVPALLLCLLWDKLGLHLGHGPALYAGHVPNHMVVAVAPRLTSLTFFGNLFFVQGVLTTTFGSDGALWSLANEFWYYILFPLGLIALWRTAAWKHRVLCALLFAVIAWFVRDGILMSFPIWLLGVALVKLPSPPWYPLKGSKLRALATLVYLPVFFGLGRIHQMPVFASDYLLALLTFLYLWVLLSDKGSFQPGSRRVIFSRELARFSYTLYAVHTPFMVFVVSLMVGDARWYPAVRTLLPAFAIFLLTATYAYGLAYWTEFRTDALRQHIERALGIGTAPATLPSNPLSVSLPPPASLEGRV